MTTLEYALLIFLIAASGLLVWQALSLTAHDNATDLSMRWPSRGPDADIQPS